MTLEQKREWLNWATEQGLLKVLDWGDIVEWEACNENSNVVAFQLKDKPLELRDILEFAIRDEIDKRGLLLRQLDIKDSSTSKIFRVTIETYKDEIIATQYATSRLEALCGAFKEAVGE